MNFKVFSSHLLDDFADYPLTFLAVDSARSSRAPSAADVSHVRGCKPNFSAYSPAVAWPTARSTSGSPRAIAQPPHPPHMGLAGGETTPPPPGPREPRSSYTGGDGHPVHEPIQLRG